MGFCAASTLRRGRSRSIDEVSVTSQISKSSRTTRQVSVCLIAIINQ